MKKKKLARLCKHCTKPCRGNITPLVQKTPQELISTITRLQQKLCWLKLKLRARLAQRGQAQKPKKVKSDRQFSYQPSSSDWEW
jgi:hypothetical protein